MRVETVYAYRHILFFRIFHLKYTSSKTVSNNNYTTQCDGCFIPRSHFSCQRSFSHLSAELEFVSREIRDMHRKMP